LGCGLGIIPAETGAKLIAVAELHIRMIPGLRRGDIALVEAD
jgi:hypothetical protein